MEEIVKHINDTNASYRTLGAGDAKNTDLFLDNEHFELFKDAGEQIMVRFNKENLQKAILFIASILPRKYDNSATHKTIPFSTTFVYDQMAFLEAFFMIEDKDVETRTQIWNARKDVQKKNGEIDNRFYFNGLLEDVSYINHRGELRTAKFTIRNYLAGGYSDLHIKKGDDEIFDVWVTNVLELYDDGKEKWLDEIKTESNLPLQQIFYGAPGTGKSHEVKKQTGELSENGDEVDLPNVFRTTFHPDTDYASFVGCYKPTMKPTSKEEKTLTGKDEEIVYEFVPQVFTDAYIYAYNNPDQATYLVIEEINRGNCAQIFGDLFQLLDRKDGKSEYKIKADKDLAQYLREKLGADSEGIQDGKLCLPANLHILATMNTSDQSLFPIDSAFKCRWEWKYMPINNHEDKGYQIEIGDAKYDWWGFLARINHVINDTTNSEDKKLGYFFAKAKDKTIDAEQFVGKVLFYLWNDVFKSYGFDDPIFSKGDNTKFEFSDFFMNNGTPNTDTVNLFLRKLEETIKMEKTPMEIKPDSQDNGQGE